MVKQSFPIHVVLTCASAYAFFEASGMFMLNDFLGTLKPVCDFMTQSKNWLHDIPRIADEIKPYILEQHPWIAEIELRLKAMDREGRARAIPQILVELKVKYGDELSLIPIHPEDHRQINDPVQAWKENFGTDVEIIELRPDETDEDEGEEPPIYGQIS